MKQAYTEIDSPVGRLLLAGEQGCLRALLFGEGPKRATPQEDWVADAVPFRPVIDQLNAYFRRRAARICREPRSRGHVRSNCGCGGNSRGFRMGRRSRTDNSRRASATPKHPAPWDWRTDRIRFRSSSPAIA